MNTRDLTVAVVGAGVAGLVCARELVARGARVQVFDKGRSPGGRIATRRVEPGCSFDHGAQYFTARDPGFGRAIADWLDRGVVAEWPGRLVSLEGGSADLSAGLAVRAGTRITSATRGAAGWTLTDEARGTSGPYDALVVTLPAPQAAELLGSHPFAAEAVAIRMAPCWAVMVAFESRLEVPWDGAFVHASALSWVARNSSKPGRDPAVDCWVLHGASDWSAANLEAAPEVAARDLMEAFAVAVGASLPAPRQVVAHRWRYSQGSDPADRRALFDPGARLAVCGDWLGGGRVEGAFLAGVRAAEVVGGLQGAI
jgi:predicted NAD/FAD-dependent oxidoreductase